MERKREMKRRRREEYEKYEHSSVSQGRSNNTKNMQKNDKKKGTG
jgi:hypothetical protein